MKTFRIFNIVTNETIIFIKKANIAEASYWVYKVYGDNGIVDVEEV